ncbi:MAG TPA: HU family DNA-binding protein [Planctomycetota bacterium]|jgi:DNA-binding protein HU-beta|nr:HU family DNA-binding protein [Planctomycetota bacterium]
MNKADLVEAMSRHMGSTKAEAERALEAFTGCVAVGLKTKGEVAILGFGTFRVSRRAARLGRNPKTGEPLQIAASKTVAFRAGKALKDAL